MKGMKTFALIAAWGLWLTGCGGGGFVQEVPPPDGQPPQIHQARVIPSNLVYIGRQVRVEAEVSDEGSGIKSVTAKIKYPDGTTQTVKLTLQGNLFANDFIAQWDAHQMPADVSRWFMTVVVLAKDKSGNVAQSSESSVRVALPPPGVPSDF